MATRDSLIQVKDLKKHYKGGTIRALDGVTVDIFKGDVMAVIGPSGSGKSTFLRSLNLLEEPTGGAIFFNGVDITKRKYKDASGKTVKLNIDELRQKMGMVFQHFNLFPHMTILDNMTLAPIKVKGMTKEAAEKKALELLDRVGLKDRADAYPIQLSVRSQTSSRAKRRRARRSNRNSRRWASTSASLRWWLARSSLSSVSASSSRGLTCS